MTTADWIIVAVVGVFAAAGSRRGFVATVLSLAGLVAGVIVGARLGPHFLHGGSRSPYTPVAALIGAAAGAMLLQAVGIALARAVVGRLERLRSLELLDSVAGVAAGAAWGIVLVWVAGAVALQLPGQTSLRRAAQQSLVLRHLNTIAAPADLLSALAKIDPLPVIAGPALPSLPPDRRLLADPSVRRAAAGVVRITATACGLGVEGTGWVARPHLVVTAAHVVAGASDVRVDGKDAAVWTIDRRDDVAVLHVPELSAKPLPFGQPVEGEAVAILGYPEDGPFDARAARIGATLQYAARLVTAFGGVVRHGNSGSPAVDHTGVVRTTVFAARLDTAGGYGLPADTVRAALARAHGPVSTGRC